MNIKVVAFDADDTLWQNEHYFKQTEDQFCSLLADYLPQWEVEKALFETEIVNLPLYGYGIKGFILSMIETAIRISENRLDPRVIEQIVQLGKGMLNEPVELMDGITDVLDALKGKYKLIVATKGDLLDQERKLKKSGLLHYFHHIEVMTEKDEENYMKLLKHLEVGAEELLMIGNSLKSDVLPVLNIGGHAFHIPFHITSVHEQVKETVEHERFRSLLNIREVLQFL